MVVCITVVAEAILDTFKGRAYRIWWPIAGRLVARGFRDKTKNFDVNSWKNGAAMDHVLSTIAGGSGQGAKFSISLILTC